MSRARAALETGLGATVLMVMVACGASSLTDPEAASQTAPSTTAAATEPSGSAPPPAIREGTQAASQRVTFAPTSVVLPGGERSAVFPATTVRGELQVPENVDHVGWWDGSAFAGDPFGATVIAGHVDSATEGLGYFARLLTMGPGETIRVSDGTDHVDYRVTSVKTITKSALATSSGALDQTGEHRLVLITCSGSYRPDTGYDSNFVVTAEPIDTVG